MEFKLFIKLSFGFIELSFGFIKLSFGMELFSSLQNLQVQMMIYTFGRQANYHKTHHLFGWVYKHQSFFVFAEKNCVVRMWVTFSCEDLNCLYFNYCEKCWFCCFLYRYSKFLKISTVYTYVFLQKCQGYLVSSVYRVKVILMTHTKTLSSGWIRWNYE